LFQLVDQTADVNLAEGWLKLLPSIEGVVAKRADRRYAPGRGRDWVKGAPRQASSIQEVKFLRCQGPANQQQSSPALCKVTRTAKRGQSD
jgi:hypothetical protein